MSKAEFCQYGAAQTLTALEQLERAGQVGESEALRLAAVRLQACLTLFYPCFPPTRIAFWKRRLRRLIRALNALHDHLRLMHNLGATPFVSSPVPTAGKPSPLLGATTFVSSLAPTAGKPSPLSGATPFVSSPVPTAGKPSHLLPTARKPSHLRRILLRLQQRVEALQEKAQQAWERLHKEHIPNEIRGLAKRQVADGEGQVANDRLKKYAQARWNELARVNLRWLEGGAPAEPKGTTGMSSHPVESEALASQSLQSLETRWGRLQIMAEIVELLTPLLGEELPLPTLQARYRELDEQRFRARAIELLAQLKEEERALTLRYQGHLRGFWRIEREFNHWIEQFQSDRSEGAGEAGGL